MISVLSDFYDNAIGTKNALNVGASAGIIDEYLSRYFETVTCIDIDEKAISFAGNNFSKKGLLFEVGDGMNMRYADESFDVIVCAQVYEHVPDAQQLMAEIWRVLKPGGVVYFAAGNRVMINEPHYNLPLLSVIPRSLAHIYIRLAGKADRYYEKHLTYWGLKSLVKDFILHDYTRQMLSDPEKYHVHYMVPPGSLKQKAAVFVAKFLIFLVPGYIWLLEKPVDKAG